MRDRTLLGLVAIIGLIVALFVLTGRPVGAQVNLVADPSFEAGWASWSVDHPLGWFATDQRKHSGNWGMYSNWTDGGHWVTSAVDLGPGVYTLTVFANTWWPDVQLIAELGDARAEWHLAQGDGFYPYGATLTTGTGGHLRFATYSPQANHSVIDDVTLHTPEPGAWLGLGAGALWMISTRGWRRRGR